MQHCLQIFGMGRIKNREIMKVLKVGKIIRLLIFGLLLVPCLLMVTEAPEFNEKPNILLNFIGMCYTILLIISMKTFAKSFKEKLIADWG